MHLQQQPVTPFTDASSIAAYEMCIRDRVWRGGSRNNGYPLKWADLALDVWLSLVSLVPRYNAASDEYIVVVLYG